MFGPGKVKVNDHICCFDTIQQIRSLLFYNLKDFKLIS